MSHLLPVGGLLPVGDYKHDLSPIVGVIYIVRQFHHGISQDINIWNGRTEYQTLPLQWNQQI